MNGVVRGCLPVCLFTTWVKQSAMFTQSCLMIMNSKANGCGGVASPTSGSIRHVTTSTRLHNGKKIVTKKYKNYLRIFTHV